MGRIQRLAGRGLILQLCSLAGIVLGAWLGIRFGTEAGALLHLDEEFAAAGGFLAVFVVVLIAVAIVGRLLRKVFHFAGFGIPDHLLGVAVSASQDAADPGAALLGVRISEQGPYAGRGKDARPVGMLPSDDPSGGFALPAARMGRKSRYQSMNKNYGATIHRNGNPYDRQLVRRPHERRGNGQVPYPRDACV